MRSFGLAAVVSLLIFAAPRGGFGARLAPTPQERALERARDFQAKWRAGRYAELLEFCPTRFRGDLVGEMIEGRAAYDRLPEPTRGQQADLDEFHRRLERICGPRLQRAARRPDGGLYFNTGDPVELGALFADVLHWLEKEGRVSRFLRGYFTGAPTIKPWMPTNPVYV